jgi:UDP-N-acetyl-D-glucosamine dehydrogenase
MTAESLGSFDSLVLATAHEQFKYKSLYGKVKLVIDTRNFIAPLFGGKPPLPLMKA